MFHPDMFPKRGYSSIFSIIAYIILIAYMIPSAIIIFLVVAMVYFIIKSVIDGQEHKEESGKSFSNTIETYKNLMLALSVFCRQNNVKSDYKDIVKSNEEIERQIVKILQSIKCYKITLRFFGFSSKIKHNYINKIKASYRKIRQLKSHIKREVICLDKYSSSNQQQKHITGHCLLLINREIRKGSLVKEEEICRLTKGNKSFFEIDKTPNIKLSFKFIEFFFYDDVILILTKNDFVVIDKDVCEVNFHTEKIKAIGVALSGCEHYWEIGVIDIKIEFHTISFLFFKEHEGKSIYEIIKCNKSVDKDVCDNKLKRKPKKIAERVESIEITEEENNK